MTASVQPVAERFFAKVEKTDDCWLWTGGLFRGREHGQFKVDKKNWQAHRYSYTMHAGPIPAGMLVFHRCDNQRCVNPAHLFLGTVHDIDGDMIEKGRQRRAGYAAAPVQARKSRPVNAHDDVIFEAEMLRPLPRHTALYRKLYGPGTEPKLYRP